MSQQYLFYVRDTLPRPEAHLIQIVQCANAAANLRYSAALTFLNKGATARNPINWLYPSLRKPDDAFTRFYSVGDHLKLLPLAMPWPIDVIKNKFTNSSMMACKYYWPFHLKNKTRLVHSRDWNFVKAAIQHGIPAIYECDHFRNHAYDPDIAQHPLLQVAVTVIDTVKENMIQNGIPQEKIAICHNGYNQLFLTRHRAAAQSWRQKLIKGHYKQLVVYAGALYKFKGVDLLLKIAQDFPTVKFALAGGPPDRLQMYQQIIQDQQIQNVQLLGFLPQLDLAALLQAADALAYPHCSGKASTFTSPMKLFDYMAAGRPIISTTIVSLAEFKSSPAVAAWCAPDNAEEFSDCLKHVLAKHPWQWENRSGNYEYLQQFSWENRIQSILKRVDPAFRPELV